MSKAIFEVLRTACSSTVLRCMHNHHLARHSFAWKDGGKAK